MISKTQELTFNGTDRLVVRRIASAIPWAYQGCIKDNYITRQATTIMTGKAESKEFIFLDKQKRIYNSEDNTSVPR